MESKSVEPCASSCEDVRPSIVHNTKSLKMRNKLLPSAISPWSKPLSPSFTALKFSSIVCIKFPSIKCRIWKGFQIISRVSLNVKKKKKLKGKLCAIRICIISLTLLKLSAFAPQSRTGFGEKQKKTMWLTFGVPLHTSARYGTWAIPSLSTLSSTSFFF